MLAQTAIISPLIIKIVLIIDGLLPTITLWVLTRMTNMSSTPYLFFVDICPPKKGYFIWKTVKGSLKKVFLVIFVIRTFCVCFLPRQWEPFGPQCMGNLLIT